jgi:hypothetical protein
VFVSTFHDEYWSKPMRDHLTAARDAGTHLAFFASNSIYWQVRFEPLAGIGANRVMVCYKDAASDPLSVTDPPLTTVTWRDAPVNQPENELLGIMYEGKWAWGDSFPWVVANAGHWVYAGTGLKDSDLIPGLVGYEYDKVFDNGLTPANQTVLSSSPVVSDTGVPSTANGALYVAPSGALVFAAGTNYWAWKMDDNTYLHAGADSRLQTMTANLLTRMLATRSR